MDVPVYHYETLDSTNTQCRRLAAEGAVSAVVTAEGESFLLLGRELDQEAAARALFDQRLTARVEQAEIKLLAPYEDIAPGKFYPALTAAQAALDAAGGQSGALPAGSGASSAGSAAP